MTPVRDALRRLGIDHLVCAVHDRALPSRASEDIGAGSASSEGAADFFGWLAELGFDGAQLGPAGRVSPGNRSPYDGTAFSRSELGIAVGPLVEGTHGATLLDEAALGAALSSVVPNSTQDRVDFDRAFGVQRAVLDRVHARWDHLAASSPERRMLEARLDSFRRDASPWVTQDALHAIFAARYGSPDPGNWRGPDGPVDAALFAGTDVASAEPRLRHLLHEHAQALERYAREQMLAHQQHSAMRRRVRQLGVRLYGDLQVGLSLADRWSGASLFLPGYALGAPPSRTNPDGQPWGYPVLDPRQYAVGPARGPALAHFEARVGKLLAEYDGIRLDHPHGLVCPWVYRTDEPDALVAVQRGARLFETPDDPRHPSLAPLAIARADQLRRTVEPFADGRVVDLDEAQVAAYAVLVDTVVRLAAGREVLCEILSTQPFPLDRVRARHGLGRFRITQKADVQAPHDVYLADNAAPEDWIMVGTHDTPSIWAVAHRWEREGAAAPRIEYLAARLCPDGPPRRDALARWLAARPSALAMGELANLFVGRARHVTIFVSDLLGELRTYNRPGSNDADNWSIRVPADFRRVHRERTARGRALDLPLCLALALSAEPSPSDADRALVDALLSTAQGGAPVRGSGDGTPGGRGSAVGM